MPASEEERDFQGVSKQRNAMAECCNPVAGSGRDGSFRAREWIGNRMTNSVKES